MLCKHGSFEIVGEAEDGIDAVAKVKSHSPDLLVLDIAMPKTTGVEVIEEVRRWNPQTKIAAVTGVSSLHLLQHIIDSGVEGIFLKSDDSTDWAQDLLAICEGATRHSAELDSRLSSRTDENSLTRRERQILFGIARGEGNSVIAERLGISPNTVDNHRSSIMRKLDVHSAPELVTRAFKDGLLAPSDIE
jgi:DNA-binding NarL/FixJ family response regulator